MTNGIERSIETLAPAVDILETPNSYLVKLDIPGASKEKISAKVENSSLVVTAQTNDSETPKEYRREFSLADDIDVNSIDAKYELGVLTVTLNKKQQYLPKEIIIN